MKMTKEQKGKFLRLLIEGQQSWKDFGEDKYSFYFLAPTLGPWQIWPKYPKGSVEPSMINIFKLKTLSTTQDTVSGNYLLFSRISI